MIDKKVLEEKNEEKLPIKIRIRNYLVKETKELAWFLLVVMIIRTFIYQPFNIPSGSMISTLLVGDFIIANKFCYGYSNQTFPFKPSLFKGRIWGKMPKQGEVVLFTNHRHPSYMTNPNEKDKTKTESLDYVKRLIGMPGDRIQVKQGELYINGNRLPLEPDGTYQYTDLQGNVQVLHRYKETLPNGIKHVILRDHSQDESWHNNTKEYVVPKDHIFMMGDNRDHSMDSRWDKEVSYISINDVIGRAEAVFFSVDVKKWYEFWKWPFNIRTDRIFTAIK